MMGHALLAAMFAIVLGACEALDLERGNTFTIIAPAKEFVDELVVDVVDLTGTVEAVEAEPGHFPDGVFVEATDPAVIVVTWMGGMCDTHTTLTVQPTLDTVRISEATEARPGDCRLARIVRSIAIRFDPPLAPEFIEFASAANGP